MRSVPVRFHSMSRKLRRRFYYSVPTAGGQVGLKRSQSYAAAEEGLIPTVRHGKFLLVRKDRWDARRKQLGL
jgi:hypothetical protein